MGFLQSYFYWDTIVGFKHLPADDNIKMLMIDFWKYLVNAGKNVLRKQLCKQQGD